MKGVILAGGSGTRLKPLTTVVSKQLLPVYDKPMVYYPLSTLILAGVTQVLLISNSHEIDRFKQLLGDGSKFGIQINYEVQLEPRGIAEGVQIASRFIGNEGFWFILGDNLFHGPDFGSQLTSKIRPRVGAHVFPYRVSNPSQYGVIEFTPGSPEITGITEKPKQFISDWALPGLYYFDETAFQRTCDLRPSSRGELEVTDLLEHYRASAHLSAHKVSRGSAWFDLGTVENLLVGSQFVHAIQTRQGMLVGSPEEAAFRMGLLSKEDIQIQVQQFGESPYLVSVLSALSVE